MNPLNRQHPVPIPSDISEFFITESDGLILMPYQPIPRYFLNYAFWGTGISMSVGKSEISVSGSLSAFQLYVFNRRASNDRKMELADFRFDHDRTILDLEVKTLDAYGVLEVIWPEDAPIDKRYAILKRVEQGLEYEEMLEFCRRHRNFVNRVVGDDH